MNAPTELSNERLSVLPPSLRDLLVRLDECRKQGRGERGPGTAAISVDHYFSSARWQAEQTVLFGQLPIVAAHRDELPAGSALVFDALGAPIVLTRDNDGRARAFLNVCRHRGMALVKASAPNHSKACATLVCPYHGWTYQLDGRLKHRLHPDAFEGIDPATLNLTEVPCSEAAGLIFVKRQPGPAFAADRYLAGLAPELEWMGLSQMKLFRKVDYVRDANWKLTADAFLEVYHIRVLHRTTIYPFFADSFTANDWHGPHLNSLVGRKPVLEPFEVPQDIAGLCKLTTPTQLLFPNTFLIWHPDYVSIIGMFSPEPERVRWIHTMLIPPAKSGDDWKPHWEKTFELIERTVFQREDIASAEGIQRGLKSGANTHFQVGQLEHPMQVFHAEIEQRLRAAERGV